jgi:hypothetical protein
MHSEDQALHAPTSHSEGKHEAAHLIDVTPPVLVGETGHGVQAGKASQMQIEAAKILLSSSIDFVKGATQVLQAFTSLLVTAYVAVLLGVTRTSGFDGFTSLIWALLPLVCWVASLAGGYMEAVSYQGSDLEFDSEGNPINALETYERVLRDRRRHLIFPSVLSLIGILAFIISLFEVLIPSNG